MKMTVQPGKRPGSSKTLFDRLLSGNDVEVSDVGEVVITFVADDIYTSKATQRFSITLNQTEVSMVRDALHI